MRSRNISSEFFSHGEDFPSLSFEKFMMRDAVTLSDTTSTTHARVRPFRVLIISAKSGGGHDGTAKALLHWIKVALGQPVEAQIIDLYAERMQSLPRMARLRGHSNFLWNLFCKVTEIPWILRVLVALLRRPVVRTVIDQARIAPDLLIAVHFVAAQCIDEIAGKLPKRPMTLTVASDYIPVRAWFGSAQLTVASSPGGVERGVALGHPYERLFGVPLLPCLPIPAKTVTRSGDARLHVLTVVGADGTSGRQLLQLLRLLDNDPSAERFSFEIICGTNHALQDELTALAAAIRQLRIVAHGFVDNLPQRFADADLALLRLSPLVMTEALSAGIPVIGFDWHAHEAGNPTVLEQCGGGTAHRSISRTVAALITFANDPAAFRRARDGAHAASINAFGPATAARLLCRLGYSFDQLEAA